MTLRGGSIRLRAVEPADVDLLCAWENDETVWQVSGTVEPFSRAQMERFVAAQCEGDILRRGDLRLIIEAPADTATAYFGECAALSAAAGSAAHTAPQDPHREPAGNTQTHTGAGDPEEPVRPGNPASLSATSFRSPEAHAAANRNFETSGVSAEAQRTAADTVSSPAPSCEPAAPADRATGGEPHFRPVGAIDLFDYEPLAQRAGVGILIHRKDDRGRGFASDALETLCRYARERLRLHQLWCEIDPDNSASMRLFRRAGFARCGVKRDWHWSPEGYRDVAMLQKIFD